MSSLDSLDSHIDAIVLKTQKKLSSLFVNRKTIAPVLDANNKKLLNAAYSLFKEAVGTKDANKLMCRWIKILMKVTILARNDQFSTEELNLFFEVQTKFQILVKVIVSFWTIDFTFDYSVIKKLLVSIEDLLQGIVARHMTEKNKIKLSDLFVSISDEKLLTLLFNKEKDGASKLDDAIRNLVSILDSMSSEQQL